MVNGACVIRVDAYSHGLAITSEDRTTEYKNDLLGPMLDEFTTDQFKSLFFLLIDYMGEGEDDFFSITKQNKSKLKEMFRKIIEKHNIELLFELLGTLKMYKHLKALGTCFHIFKNCQEGGKLNNIDNFWKMLFSLCEEISDSEFVLLKDSVPSFIRDQIIAAEDYFFWAFKRNIFSKSDVSNLLETFAKHPACSKIIQDFQANLNRYPVKIPTDSSHCGVALIFNYDMFDRESCLPERKGSDIDINSLKNLWKEFGFETKIFSNLTCEETFHELKNSVTSDYSDYDVFVCCFLSHGKRDSIISSDGYSMPISNLVAEVINHSESFDTKPKLFFIQACQGPHILQQGVRQPVHRINSAQEPVIKEWTNRTETPPILCDVLVAVSSIEGFVSFREPENGSWFINALCNAMNTSGDKKSILDVMSEVNNHVRKKSTEFGPASMASQIVKLTSTLDKILILKKRIC